MFTAKKQFLMLLILVLLPLYAAGQDQEPPLPSVQHVVSLLSESGKHLKSFSADLVQRKHFFLFDEEEVYSGKIFYEAPDKMLIQIEKPILQVLGSDGKTGWLYLPSIKQVQRMSIETIKNKGASFVKFLVDPSRYFQEKNVSITQVIPDGDDRILKIQIDNTAENNSSTDFLKLTLWIRESRPLPVIKLEVMEKTKDVVWYELSHVVHNPKLQSSLLKPKFPKDTEIIDY